MERPTVVQPLPDNDQHCELLSIDGVITIIRRLLFRSRSVDVIVMIALPVVVTLSR